MENKGKKWKTVLKVLISVFIIVGVLYLLQRLLMPKYMSGVVEGAMIAEYYDEDKNHDVIFVGDCELYENISPVVLWEEYGINSFIRGSAQQLIWQSYYLMEETLKYEKPQVIVFNVLSMKYDKPQKETYNRMTIDGMKWSSSKIGSIMASMTEEEEFLDYVFPLLRYHSRWNELSKEDLTYFWKRDKVTHNGYYMRVDVLPVENIPEPKVLADYTFGDNSYYYLDKMVELCKANDVELVLVKAPSLYPAWYDEWDEQMVSYAQEHGLKYYNFLECTDEIGLDYSTDTYDAGLHLNLSGAEKMAHYFGNILATECNVTDRRNDENLVAKWAKKREAYDAEIAAQYESIEKNGAVIK